jgi:hypothetical protein
MTMFATVLKTSAGAKKAWLTRRGKVGNTGLTPSEYKQAVRSLGKEIRSAEAQAEAAGKAVANSPTVKAQQAALDAMGGKHMQMKFVPEYGGFSAQGNRKSMDKMIGEAKAAGWSVKTTDQDWGAGNPDNKTEPYGKAVFTKGKAKLVLDHNRTGDSGKASYDVST